MKNKIILTSAICFFFISLLTGQTSQLYIPKNFQHAYANGTRSMDGKPGLQYWQNRSDYDVKIKFDPRAGFLTGEEKITYYNNSPDTLQSLVFNLFPNYFQKSAVRDYKIDPRDENNGVAITKLLINGHEVDLSPETGMAEINQTKLTIHLDAPILPGSTSIITVVWSYSINKYTHLRTGRVDSTTWFIGYFFPRIAVYDDIDGWDLSIYKGQAEFYNDFGDFHVEISVPPRFIVFATGLLQNPDKVLNEKYATRLKAAFSSDEIVHIIKEKDINDSYITPNKPFNKWVFMAENVTDFAFATSDHYLWDATSLEVDNASGRRVLIDAAYNKNSHDFYQVCDIARKSIKFMSFEFPGVPFPYPNETVFNGLSEMEFPMMVNDHSVDDFHMLVGLTSHEIFHTYFPFFMGTNEIKYAWMDEGWATLGDFLISSVLDTITGSSFFFTDSYNHIMGKDEDMPIITNSYLINSPTYQVNSYTKTAMFYYMLMDVLGDNVFKMTVQEYINRWNGKHPMPYDFFFTLNEVCGQNLDWLFNPWFFEYGYPDLSIKTVTPDDSGYTVIIEKVGHYPVPIHLVVFREDGSTQVIHKAASAWKEGNDTFTFNLEKSKKIIYLSLGDITIPDADKSNNIFLFD